VPSPRNILALFACALLATSCAVTLVAPYDSTTDNQLSELSVKTETAIARADADQLSADDRTKFYQESIGSVRAMEARSSLYAKNEKEIDALKELEKAYTALRDRGVSPRTSLAGGVRSRLSSVQQIQIAKKRSSIFSAGLKSNSS
jgi:hypothetical protein